MLKMNQVVVMRCGGELPVLLKHVNIRLMDSLHLVYTSGRFGFYPSILFLVFPLPIGKKRNTTLLAQ